MSTIIARAVLTSGAQHDDVHELGRILAGYGFENSVSRGENPFGLVDDTVLAAVQHFRSAYGIEEETTIVGVPSHERRNWIGPVFWDAILTPAGKPRQLKAPAAA